MSYAAFKMMHSPTAIETCASGYITHSNHLPKLPAIQTEDSDWLSIKPKLNSSIPNLVVTAANVLEVYVVRVSEDSSKGSASEVKRGGLMDGVSGASLELVCHYRLHGNIYSMAILPSGGGDGRRRDSIILTFDDAKISVLEFDDSVHGLHTSSMHCFEGPEWLHLKRGRETFPTGPLVKVDPQGRCAGVLVYGLQMIILKAAQAGGFVGDENTLGTGGACCARVESSYIISLRDLEMKHVKDFVFINGYIEPVLVILHEHELTWAGRVSWKHHTCGISALSISTSLKQHPLIWSASNLPHEAYKLLAVPSPIGGVIVISTNTIHYHSQSASCVLALNNFAVSVDGSQEMTRSNFRELLLLKLVYDGRVVQRLDLSKSKASVLTSGITTIGNSLFFLASRLGDSLLVQFTSGVGASTLPPGMKEEVGDIDGDVHLAKRIRRSSSDALQDMVNGDELSLYGSGPNNAESTQKTFSFTVRDSLINVGPLKDFSYGLRINADHNATGIAKQSNYELVCCSGHGKNGALCVLQQSIRPEVITQEPIPGCKGLWTVYHKTSRSHTIDSSKSASDDDEYHAYLIISLESRTMVLQTVNNLEEVTENVDYYVQGSTVAAGNLFGRLRVIQIYARGARILDGAFMTQELTFKTSNSESGSGSEIPTVSSVSIADPYVLLRMSDGSIQLIVGDPSTSTVSTSFPAVFENSKKSIASCTLYHDKGPEPWLRKTSTDAWLSSGIGEAIDGSDSALDQGDVYCVVCYESGILEIFDVPNFSCVFSLDNFESGKAFLGDTFVQESSNGSEKYLRKNSEETENGRKENNQRMKVVELAMHRWSGQHSRPFLFGILADGSVLCYQAYLYEGLESSIKVEEVVPGHDSVNLNNTSSSRLKNLRFARVPLDTYIKEEISPETPYPRITTFKNVGGFPGLFLAGSRPMWFMIFRERLRIHPQLCDGPIAAFTVLHNVYCNHGIIYVTQQGTLKICQLPSLLCYDNYWPIPLKGTPHQVTYFAEKNLYPLIVSVPVSKSSTIQSIICERTDP
ncbi:Cleavage and polyadenylation specificity factor subunit 1 [Heracleum sosnowskyi]|uniref:Cleavage and polyadenylation specificity factor subunit 1 n=1 Tax=Heracleum sosnowskyi TaxID=360622 RepID=A0AAD8IZS8_9APIA|nr:Cleavage and polyadenylation specificity factor subunit 1 [Heracleum sosnowskyi]